jgi:hypothetical protein
MISILNIAFGIVLVPFYRSGAFDNWRWRNSADANRYMEGISCVQRRKGLVCLRVPAYWQR